MACRCATFRVCKDRHAFASITSCSRHAPSTDTSAVSHELLMLSLRRKGAHPEPDHHNECPRCPPLPLTAEELHVARELLFQHLVALILRNAVRRCVTGSRRQTSRQAPGEVGGELCLVGKRGAALARQRRCLVVERPEVARYEDAEPKADRSASCSGEQMPKFGR